MIAPSVYELGQTITFNGYADDYGTHIVAVEFSLDGGESWSRCDTSSSNGNLAVQWSFQYEPKTPGRYRFMVRSVTEDGRVSPMAATTEFFVE